MSSSKNGSFLGGVPGFVRDALSLCLFIAGMAIALYLVDLGCIFKTVTGLSCPGCGMTRAWLSALRLDFSSALAYHPLFWAVPIAIALVYVQAPCAELVRRAEQEPGSVGRALLWVCSFVVKHGTMLLSTLIAAFLALWVIRMIEPCDAGLLFGGAPPDGVISDVVGWTRPVWMDWFGM